MSNLILIVSPKAARVIKAISETLSKSPTGVSFFSIKNYTNESGEVADHLFNIGASYENAKKSDLHFLQNLDITKHVWKSSMVDIAKARAALIESIIKPNKGASEGQINAYTQILPGVKVHNETGALYIYGYRVNKTVHVEGEYKKVNSGALTIAKNELRKHLKTNNFRMFIMSECGTIKGNGETIEIQ